MTSADLEEKTGRYERMLADALELASPSVDAESGKVEGDECIEMASAYLQDGMHFREEGDLINALASFSYGHGWIDAAARLGAIDVPKDSDLFTI